MAIIEEVTDRGFKHVIFKDTYDQTCRLYESSAATQDAIWLSNEDGKPIHLSQDNVQKILPYLQKFVETGRL